MREYATENSVQHHYLMLSHSAEFHGQETVTTTLHRKHIWQKVFFVFCFFVYKAKLHVTFLGEDKLCQGSLSPIYFPCIYTADAGKGIFEFPRNPILLRTMMWKKQALLLSLLCLFPRQNSPCRELISHRFGTASGRCVAPKLCK